MKRRETLKISWEQLSNFLGIGDRELLRIEVDNHREIVYFIFNGGDEVPEGCEVLHKSLSELSSKHILEL
jgi:hypothetical protein